MPKKLKLQLPTPSEVFVADVAALFTNEIDCDEPINGANAVDVLVQLILRARKIERRRA
jgi:hypothetical protein